MRIVFICPVYRTGNSGVGDYTFRLARFCSKQGFECAILSFKEMGVVTQFASPGSVVDEANFNSNQRSALDFVRRFNPDWISLQYVPYGYHPKGYCFHLGRFLKSISGNARRHVFFHEVSVGLHQEESWKNRVHGFLQRMALRRWLSVWPPDLLHTHAVPYQQWLEGMGVSVKHLPLYGNIPVGPTGPVHPEFDEWTKQRNQKGEKLLLAGYFGSLYPGAAQDGFLDRLRNLAQKTDQRIICFLVGQQSDSAKKRWQMLVEQSDQHLKAIFLGELSEEGVSSYLQQLDFGIAATPWALIEKSGSAAAMLDHGLPVLVPRNDWTPRLKPQSSAVREMHHRLIPAWDDHFVNHTDWLQQKESPGESFPAIAEAFLKDLSALNSQSPLSLSVDKIK